MDEFLRFGQCTLFSYTPGVPSPLDLPWLLLQLPWCMVLSVVYVMAMAGAWALLLALVAGLVAVVYVLGHVAIRV